MQRKPYRVVFDGRLWLVIRQYSSVPPFVLNAFHSAAAARNYIALREKWCRESGMR